MKIVISASISNKPNLNTAQVRALLKAAIPGIGNWANPIWTNKVKNPEYRSVKIYCPLAPQREALVKELQEKVGSDFVKIKKGSGDSLDAIIITCLAK